MKDLGNMTPNQARAARAYLNLDMVTVCMQVPIGKRTLTEFERGSRNIADTTLSRLMAFYNVRGIAFSSQLNGDSITFVRKEINQEILADDQVKEKIEYDNRFGLYDISILAGGIKELALSCNSAVNFSRDIIIYAMSSMKFNQKQIACFLNCSPAFISAVILQKKMLSLDIANFLELKLGVGGFSAMALSEKKIRKSIDVIQREVVVIESEIDQIKKQINKS